MSDADATGRAKVFGIGLNKTGTRSLHEALGVLGYRSLHWGGPPVRRLVERALADGRPLLDDLGGYDAFSDILALSTNFALLDEQYPGSRFVLTTRDLDAWLESRRRHVELNLAQRAAGCYEGNFLTVDIDLWIRERAEHEAGVHRHFDGRPRDLLVMNIAAGDGYEELCSFLGRPVPDGAFPRVG